MMWGWRWSNRVATGTAVTPANAGDQYFATSVFKREVAEYWVPACAGMTQCLRRSHAHLSHPQMPLEQLRLRIERRWRAVEDDSALG